MDFKNWIYNEAKLVADTIAKLDSAENQSDSSGKIFKLFLDKKGDVHAFGDNDEVDLFSFDSPYVVIDTTAKTIMANKMSPQSVTFKKIINALKSKYKDIENWKTASFLDIKPAKNRQRSVGYWLSRINTNLSNKMPPFFYHGTSTYLWYDGIKDKGILPRQKTGLFGSYGTQSDLLSQDNLVYLSTDPDVAARHAAFEAARKNGGNPLILKIRSDGLDPNKLVPDEDSRQQTPEESLDRMSTVAYRGRIPSENIQPFLFVTEKEHKGYDVYDFNNQWVKFYDIPKGDHAIIRDFEQYGEGPELGTPSFFALLDAGIIDENSKLIVDLKQINNEKISQILKNSYWVLNARDLFENFDTFFKAYTDHVLPAELKNHPLIAMLLSTPFVYSTVQGKDTIMLNFHADIISSGHDFKSIIEFAKKLGKTSLKEFSSQLETLMNTHPDIQKPKYRF